MRIRIGVPQSGHSFIPSSYQRAGGIVLALTRDQILKVRVGWFLDLG